MIDYPNLEWAFLYNTKNFLSILYDNKKENPYYLKNIDKFMEFLREKNCKNVQEKLAFVADMWNYRSILSELEIAKILLEKGKNVKVLPDNYGGIISPPDLHVSDQICDAYIEVTRITDDQTIQYISDKLDEKIRKEKIPFAIDVDLNNEISVPAFSNERDLKKQKLENGFNEFSDKYDSLSIKKQSVEISTSIGIFKIRDSKLETGYAGAFLWGSGIPYEKIIQKIERDIIIKAEKREKWKNEHLRKYYIIALDFEDVIHDPMYLKSAIFGSMAYIDVDPKLLIEKAKKAGWSEYLNKMDIVSGHNFLDPNKWGVFFTSNAVRNTSGIIGKFPGGKTVFYPNPFSFKDINDPKLVDYLEDG